MEDVSLIRNDGFLIGHVSLPEGISSWESIWILWPSFIALEIAEDVKVWKLERSAKNPGHTELNTGKHEGTRAFALFKTSQEKPCGTAQVDCKIS